MNAKKDRQIFYHFLRSQNATNRNLLPNMLLSLGYIFLLIQNKKEVEAIIKKNHFKKIESRFSKLNTQLAAINDPSLNEAKRLACTLLFVLSCNQLTNECHPIQNFYKKQKDVAREEQCEKLITEIAQEQKIYWTKLEELTEYDYKNRLAGNQREFFKLIDKLTILYIEKQSLASLKSFVTQQTNAISNVPKAHYRAEILLAHISIRQDRQHNTHQPTPLNQRITRKYGSNTSRSEAIFSALFNEKDRALKKLIEQDEGIKKYMALYSINKMKKDIYHIEARLHPFFLSRFCNKIQTLLYTVMDAPSQSKQYDTVAEKIMQHFFDVSIEEKQLSQAPTIGGLSLL